MAGHVHVPRDRAGDEEGFPVLSVAHSRKVQKGEDFDLIEACAGWTPKRTGSKSASDDDTIEFAMFGLFDGHGGKDCAAHCEESFLREFLTALDAPGPLNADEDAEDCFERRMPGALRACFAAVDEAFLVRDIHSGATATIVVMRGRCVTTAAVGDSLATLDLGPGIPVLRLSNEHRLDTSESERKRIEEAGGEVRPTEYEDGPNGERVGVGPLRVWPGGLAVSRSIGDRDGKRGGVTSEPEVSMVVIPDGFHGARLVLASDGLWDAATPKQASACGSKMNVQNCATALNKLAQSQKDNRDDITVLVVDLLHDTTKSGPFITKPSAGEQKPRLYWPFSKKAHDPLPLPSERRALRKQARREREDTLAALEAIRKADEEEMERVRLEKEAAESRAKMEYMNSDGWEEAGSKSHSAKPTENHAEEKPASRNVAKNHVRRQHQTNGKREDKLKAATPKKKPAKAEKNGTKVQDIPDVSKLTLSESEKGERPKQKRKGRREREKERQYTENSSSDISQLAAPLPVKSNAAENSMQPPQNQASAPPMSHGVGMYGYLPQGRPPSPLIPPQGMPPPMPPIAHPQIMFMRPGFTQPMAPYGRSHSPVGHMQPLMNAVRAPSPPMPPFPPPSHRPITWQQQQSDQSKPYPSHNQLPPNSTPETPVKQDEVPKDNQGQKRKAKRKGRRERERERMEKRAAEQAVLNSSAQN